MSANAASNARGVAGEISVSLGTLYERRWLVWYFVQRQLTKSYRGSFLGLTWLILGPLLMVALYTLVFSEIIGLRFRQTDSVSNFGLYLYCGLLPFLAVSETLTKSASVIRGNSSLVKRMVFPLEILPLSTAATAFITQFFGFGALLALVALFEGHLQWTLVFLPIVAVPQLLLVLGLGHLVAVAGAYVPDLKESLSALTRVMFFATPIIWPADRVPPDLWFIVDLNPLAFLVEAYRNVVLDGVLPSVTGLLWFTLFSAAVMVVGIALFIRIKKQFADLI